MSPLNIIIAIFVLISLYSSFRKGAARRAEQMEALRSASERAQAMPPRPDAAASPAASPLSWRGVPHPQAASVPRLHEPYVSSWIVAPSEGVLTIPEPHADVVSVPVPSGGSITGTTFEGMGMEGEQDELHAAHVPPAMPADLSAQESLAQISLAELRRAVVLSELLGPPRAHRRAGRATH